MLVRADRLFRKEVARLLCDERESFDTFSAALLHVLKNRKDLWMEARTETHLEKLEQGHHAAPGTPPGRRTPGPGLLATPTKSKGRRDRMKRKFDDFNEASEAPSAPAKVQGKGSGKGSSGKGPGSRPSSAPTLRVPDDEWKKLAAMKYEGRPRGKFFNCSAGCRFGGSCKQLHVCMECGGDHAWVAAHK